MLWQKALKFFQTKLRNSESIKGHIILTNMQISPSLQLIWGPSAEVGSFWICVHYSSCLQFSYLMQCPHDTIRVSNIYTSKWGHLAYITQFFFAYGKETPECHFHMDKKRNVKERCKLKSTFHWCCHWWF